VKAFYPLTSKLDTPAQLAKHERRRRVLRRVAQTGHCSHTSEQPVDLPAVIKDHHYIPKLSRNNPLHIFRFLQEHDNDPAVAVGLTILVVHLAHDNLNLQAFLPKLRDHILYRLRKLDVTYCDHTFTDDERNSVIIFENRLYSVQTMQVCFASCRFC
jgi:hypothetical protein